MSFRIQDTFADVRRYAEDYGLYIDTHSLGDGVRRYRFFTDPEAGYSSGRGVGTVLSLQEARDFVDGWCAAIAYTRDNA